MPESIIQDKYVDSVPRFNLPPELTNAKPETPPAPPAEAPKEPKPVAEAATTEPEKPESETTGKDPEKPPIGRFQKRIEKAHRERAEAQAKAEALERELQALKTQKPPAPLAPRKEDFTDVDEYAKAFAAYEKDNALKEYEKKRTEEAQNQWRSKVVEEWESKVGKALSKYEDFEDVVGDLKPTTPWAVAIMEEENGEEVAYYLGKHVKEAQKIFELSPLSQAREIGKLAMKLSLKTEEPKQPSKAPAPITPVTGAAQVSDGEYRPGMPFEEYLKIGNKMFRGRR